PSGPSFDQELAIPGFTADESESQEVEGLRLAEPASFAVLLRKSSELDEPGLLGMQRQRILRQLRAQLVQKTPGIAFVLEPDDEVIGIAHDDHVARGLALPPVFGPVIENVVQIDIRKKRRDDRPLPGSRPLVFTIPSSSTPTLSHFWIRRMMRRSP